MFLIVVPLVVQNVFSALLKPISEQIQVVQNFREKNRGSKLFNHLSAVSESIPALGWVAMVRTALGAGFLGRVGRVWLPGEAAPSAASCQRVLSSLGSEAWSLRKRND